MPISTLFHVRMRPADLAEKDFHLLEELAKPRACLTAVRVCCWVYHGPEGIRELVLSGHTEAGTCLQASNILIEAARRLDGPVSWKMTCGAAHFRVETPSIEVQEALGSAVVGLRELAENTGLITVIDTDWRLLTTFRNNLRSWTGTRPPLVILPVPESGRVADYVPLVPGPDPEGEPLEFRLEGWDFDYPEFQAVANVHLRNMRRELLRDALNRREIYRSWLKEWTEQWVRGLHFLPKEQARTVTIAVPAPVNRPGASDTKQNVMGFIRALPSFLDTGQTWPKRLEHEHGQIPYELWSATELDEKHWPDTVEEVDYQRGIKSSRAAKPTDPPFIWRQRLRHQDPVFISQCLLFIRKMDNLIRPYEELETRLAGGEDPLEMELDPGMAVVAEISRRIVIETMIRGWPSFYLPDPRDRAVFEAWAQQARPRAWSILARQARRRGMALEPLLEDNIIFDVRFDADLGCTIKPLVLVDDAAHAQVHGSRLGASAFIPLWARQTCRPLDGEILGLATGNSERAQRLVEMASRRASGPDASAEAVADLLRKALACQPAEAGYHVLREWSRRLGRGTGAEFQRARDLVEAYALCQYMRHGEARPRIMAHLAAEPDPVPDALVIAALCELASSWDLARQHAELEEAARNHDALVPRHNELVEKLQRLRTELGKERELNPLHGFGIGSQRFLDLFLQSQPLQQKLEQIGGELQLEKSRCDRLTKILEEHRQTAGTLIRKALSDFASVGADRPALSRAALEAPAELAAVLTDEGFLSLRPSEAFSRRYDGVRKLVYIRGTLEIWQALAEVHCRVDRDPECMTLQKEADELRRLSQDVRLPSRLAEPLKDLISELDRGKGDRILHGTLLTALKRAMAGAISAIRDRMSDAALSAASYGEELEIRIHILQCIELRFRVALQAMLNARVTLARVASQTWTVCHSGLAELPAGAGFRFEAASGTVFVTLADGRTPLLHIEGIAPEETAHLARIFADPELPSWIDPLAPSLAESVLLAEVKPGPPWQVWRDAMALIEAELLCSLSFFSYRACLLPELSPPLAEAGREARKENIVPRDAPEIDWQWSNLDLRWRKLLGRRVRRASGVSSNPAYQLPGS
jgi:hypothetical protein